MSVYLTKVPDSASADGSTGWFKIFEDGWAKKGSGVGDDDFWGTRDLNACCGKMDVKVPGDIADGDYLLRAEAIALHTAAQANGAQLYMSCYQITVAGGTGTATPALVKFPGAYKAGDPGLQINIHAAVNKYVIPGPEPYGNGTIRTPSSTCTGCEKDCKAGAAAGKAGGGSQPKTTAAGGRRPAPTPWEA